MDKFLILKSEKGEKNSGSHTEPSVETPASGNESDNDTASTTSTPRKRRKISMVWKYFKKTADKRFAKCLSCGKWSAPVPKCEPVKCPSLDSPEKLGEPHLQIEEHDNNYGGKAIFSCAWGYKLIGPPGIECELSGNWSEHPPKCIPIQCPPPVLPVNGHLIQSEAPGMDGGRYAVGSLVQFACTGAHHLEGEASIICTETGHWSHPPPFCRLKCSYIGEPENGFTSPTKFAYDPGDELQISCNEGFATNSDIILKCLPDGKWSSSLPECHNVTTTHPEDRIEYSK